MTSYYTILGLPNDASKDEIKKAYKKIAIACHPDRVSPQHRPDLTPGEREAMIARFKEANAAHEVLSNDERRAAYDAELEQEEMFSGAQGQSGVGAPPDAYRMDWHMAKEFFKSEKYIEIIWMLADENVWVNDRIKLGFELVDTMEKKGLWADLLTLSTYPTIPTQVMDAAYNRMPTAVAYAMAIKINAYSNDPVRLSDVSALHISLTTVISTPGIPLDMRIRMGRVMVENYKAHGWYAWLAEIGRNEEMPDTVRASAYNELPVLLDNLIKNTPREDQETVLEACRYFTDMCTDYNIESHVRMRLGVLVVDFYKAIGMVGGLSLIFEEEMLPADIRNYANSSIPEAAVNAIAEAKSRFEATGSEDFMKSLHQSLMDYIRYSGADPAISKAVAFAMAEKYAEYGWLSLLGELMEDVPADDVRHFAKNSIQEATANAIGHTKNLSVLHQSLMDLVGHPETDPAIRKAVAIAMAESYVKFYGLCWLRDLVDNINTPWEARGFAIQKIMLELDRFMDKARQDDLIELIGDDMFPENFRTLIGNKLISRFIGTNDWQALFALSKLRGSPQALAPSVYDALYYALGARVREDKSIFRNILAMSSEKELPGSVRSGIGMIAVQWLREEKSWKILLQIRDLKNVPEDVKQAAYASLPEAMAGTDAIREIAAGHDPPLLSHIMHSEAFPLDMRVDASMKLFYELAGQGRWKDVLQIYEYSTLPTAIRSAAGFAMVTAIENAGTIEGYIKEGRIEALAGLCRNVNLPEPARALVGARLAAHLSESGEWKKLVDLSVDPGVTADVRTAAHSGISLALANSGYVDDLFKKGRYGDVLELSLDQMFPEEVRISAGVAAVSAYAEAKRRTLFINLRDLVNLLSSDKYAALPSAVKQAARDSISSLMPALIVSICSQKSFNQLLELSTDPQLPEIVRVPSGIRLVEHHLKGGDWQELRSLSQNAGIPQAVRDVAERALERLAGGKDDLAEGAKVARKLAEGLKPSGGAPEPKKRPA